MAWKEKTKIMSIKNAPVKRPFDEESHQETKKQLLEAVENRQVTYVTPYDERYPQLVASKYSNFVHQQSPDFPETLRENLAWAFNTLQDEGFFHRDWVRVKGRSFPTYVSRVLIGEPGVTYKYLGLRLFPLPWTFPGRSPENDIEKACSIIGELNMYYKETSRKLITDRQVGDNESCKLKCSASSDIATSSSNDGRTYKECSPNDGETSDDTVLLGEESAGAKINKAENKHAITENNVSKHDVDIAKDKDSKSGSETNKSGDESAILSNNVQVDKGTKNGNDIDRDKGLKSSSKTSTTETKISTGSGNNIETGSDVAKLDDDIVPHKELKSSTKLDKSASRSNTNMRMPSSRRNLPSRNSLPQGIDEQPILSYEEGTDFNVALLNFMDPNDPTLRLKEEPYYGLGELAVSWHMDTGLVKGSTVAVYSHTETENCEREDCHRWCVGVKVQWDVETPALAVPLDTGDSYYMLSDLNDTHQHCVVVGSHPRFSSTHRVAECSTGTLTYIQSRCDQAVENLEMGEGDVSSSLKSTSIEIISFTEDVHTEVEFEWMRQFWMQGNTRANERDFWLQPMEELEEKWQQMELMTKLAVSAAMDGSDNKQHVLCEKLIDYLSRRNRLRQEHINRFGGKSLVSMPSDEMPSYRPYWQSADAHHPLPFDLENIIHRLICHIDPEHT